MLKNLNFITISSNELSSVRSISRDFSRVYMSSSVLSWVVDRLDSGNKVALAVVLRTSGSVPGKVGAKLALCEGQTGFVGTVGGAGLEFKIIKRCRELLETSKTPYGETLTYGLNKGAKGYEVMPLDSLCGGQVTLSIEVLIPTPNILMMGGGHCAKAMSSTFDDLDWNYSISDSREDFCNSKLFPNAKNHYNATVDAFFDLVSASELKKYSDVLLLGHDWSEDEHRLLELLNICQLNTFLPNGKQFPRIGVIGSRSKWQAFSKKALNHGISQQLLDDVICPIGLNIGAHSPEEIAVAVAGQILSLQRNVSPSDKTWRD